MKKTIYLLSALSALLIFGSCNRQTPNPDTVLTTIESLGGPSDTIVETGSTILYSPVVKSENSTPTGDWTLNNELYAKNTLKASFTFNNTGRYALSFRAVGQHPDMANVANATVDVYAKAGGFYILNEGQYGKAMGSLNYYKYKENAMSLNIEATINGGEIFGITSCFGTQWGNSIYVVSKQGNRLVAADRWSLKKKAALTSLPDGADGHAFAGIDSLRGVLTTSKGAYVAALNPLAVGQILPGTEKTQCGAVSVEQGHIFVIKQSAGVRIYKADNYEFVKQIDGPSIGFAKTKDGSLWCADGGKIWQIDPKSLAVTEIALPEGIKIYNSWGAWNAGSIAASTNENAIYFTKGGMWGGGNEVYRYEINNPSSLDATFAKGTAEDSFYGSGISVDPKTGNIIGTFTAGYNYFDNRLVVFDGKTGAEKSRVTYEGYYFPTMVIYQ